MYLVMILERVIELGNAPVTRSFLNEFLESLDSALLASIGVIEILAVVRQRQTGFIN